MALADTTRAIGAVTKLLVDHLVRRAQPTVTHVSVGRPEEAANTTNSPKFNLFLYQVNFDGSMRNVSLQDGQPPPLWLSLKYLITAVDQGGDTDTADAQELLGLGLAALQEINYLQLDALAALDVQKALGDNPEPLKVTFDESSSDLLGRIMQGTDEKYRVSAAFQVRPVLIAPAQPASFSQLVGVDYTVTPAGLTPGDPIGLDVLASLGPQPSSVAPARVQVGDTFEVLGDDLSLANVEALIDGVPLSIVAQRADRLTGRVDASLGAAPLTSAGVKALVIRQALPNGRYRAAAPLTLTLLPTLNGVAPGAFVVSGGKVSGTFVLSGLLLGSGNDDILVPLADPAGAIVAVFDTVTSSGNQQQLTVTIPLERAVPAGNYRVFLCVNGAQARNAPMLTLA